MTMKLYITLLSPPVRAVLLTEKALGMNIEKQEINLMNKEQLSPEFVKVNPQHTVPTLDDNGTIVWDSHAIMVYLVTKYGKTDALCPKDPVKRAVVDQRLHFESGILFPCIRNIVRPIIYKGEKTISDEKKEAAEIACDFLETFLQDNEWMAGNSLTIADFSIIASLSSLNVLVPISPTKYPKLTSWMKRMQKLPYYDQNAEGLAIFESILKQHLQ